MLTLNTNIMSLTTQNYLNMTGSATTSSSETGSVPPAVVFTEPGLMGQSQVLSVGRYDMSDLTIPDDSISSLAVRKGVRVTLYEHAGFSGTSTVLTANTEALGGDVDGTVSSIVVEEI
ncbi:MAG: hypothetical protein ABI134_31500 [Byssovorax sp.]